MKCSGCNKKVFWDGKTFQCGRDRRKTSQIALWCSKECYKRNIERVEKITKPKEGVR